MQNFETLSQKNNFQVSGSNSLESFKARELCFFILISMPPSTDTRIKILNAILILS